MKRQFAKNLSSSWAVYFAAAVISFFLTPYIVQRLGQAAFGIWILVGSFSGYLGLFDFGIGFAVVRFVARYQRTGETERRNEIVATAFYLALILSLLVLALTLYVAIQAPVLFDLPADMISSARAVILLIGLSIALGFPLSVFSEALAGGLFRYDLFNLVSLVTALARTALTVALIELGWGLAGLGVAALAASLFGYLWRMRQLWRLLPDLSLSVRLVKRSVLAKIGQYSLFSFILVLSSRMAFYSDAFVVGYFRPLEEVAVYGIAAKLVEYLRQLVFTLTRLFSPVASRYDLQADQATLRRIYSDGSRLSLLFSLPLSLALFFWGGRLVHLWVGPDFDYAIVILRVLLAGHLFSFVQAVGGEMLLGVGRHRTLALLSLAAAIINIILSIILVQKIGIVGVAWGTTLPLALLSLFYLPLAAMRVLNVRPVRYLKEAIRPALTASLIPSIYIVLVSNHLHTLWSFLLAALLGVVIYMPCLYFLGLNQVEKEHLRSTIKKIKV